MTNWQPLVDELNLWKPTGRTPPFWWRDDDATADTPQLRTMLSIGAGFPIALAVIPRLSDDSLPALLANYPNVSVVQHGWRHKKHFFEELHYPAEYPYQRRSEKVYEELRSGKFILTEMFGDRFVPSFAPPYHIFCSDFVVILEALGFTGFSVTGQHADAPRRRLRSFYLHVSPINFGATPPTLGNTVDIIANLVAELSWRRTSGDTTPVGLLTHHLVHDNAINTFLHELLTILSNHPVSWRTAQSLFVGP